MIFETVFLKLGKIGNIECSAYANLRWWYESLLTLVGETPIFGDDFYKQTLEDIKVGIIIIIMIHMSLLTNIFFPLALTKNKIILIKMFFLNYSLMKNFFCILSVQAVTTTFGGFRINPYASFLDSNAGSWTAEPHFADLTSHPARMPYWTGVDRDILKHRDWLTYILCYADGGPKWSFSQLQFVRRT